MRTFGYEAFLHIEDKYKKCTFIGYQVDGFGYHLWNCENNKIIMSRYVVFNKKVMYKDQLQGKKHEKENTKYIVLDENKENEVPKVLEN